MRTVIAATLLALLPLAAAAAPAPDSRECRIGDIERLYGDVRVVRGGNIVVPVAGEAFCVHDRFLTGSRGIAALRFHDGTQVTVGKETEFGIEQWRQRRVFSNEAIFSLAKGAFRALSGAISERRHRFEVKTPIATIGVRGTEFWGGTSITPESLDVIMLNGKGVYVENEAGKVELTQAGTGTTVKAGKAPQAPSTWTEAKVQQAVSTVTP